MTHSPPPPVVLLVVVEAVSLPVTVSVSPPLVPPPIPPEVVVVDPLVLAELLVVLTELSVPAPVVPLLLELLELLELFTLEALVELVGPAALVTGLAVVLLPVTVTLPVVPPPPAAELACGSSLSTEQLTEVPMTPQMASPALTKEVIRDVRIVAS